MDAEANLKAGYGKKEKTTTSLHGEWLHSIRP